MMSNNRLNNLGRYSLGSSQKKAQIQAQQASARSIDQNPKQLAQPVQVMKEEIHDNERLKSELLNVIAQMEE